jgi:hypothetical protein
MADLPATVDELLAEAPTPSLPVPKPHTWLRFTSWEWVAVLIVPTLLAVLWVLSVFYGDGTAPTVP